MNCGYGRGSSVLEVIDVVKRVSGVDFEVRLSPAPPRAIRRRSSPRSTASASGWAGSRHDDLDEIVEQALRWEPALRTRAPLPERLLP